MAVLLQSLDSNNDAYDGIVITQEMRDAFSSDNGFNLATISEEELIAIIEATGRVAISEDDAMTHVQEMLELHTDLEENQFDERLDDDIMTAKVKNHEEGMTYSTSSGIEGEISRKGKFNYADEDEITFKNAAGEIIAVISENDLPDNGKIKLSKLNLTVEKK